MKLSPEQGKAAYTNSKRALIIAGGGSGKTRTMIARIKHLIEFKNVSPYEILCLTFTRKAAGEIKERLIKEIGSKASKITAGTIHSVALNYLQRFGELIGLKPGKITVYSPWEEEFLLKEISKELGYHTGKAWKGIKKGEVMTAFHEFYTTGHIHWDDNGKTEEILSAFFQKCKENNALTYGTILTEFQRLIPRISKFMGLRHVLSDECQDQDPLQWSILNDICKTCNASLFAVGDPRQSIYSFRGADPAYLERNKHQFDIYNLKDNYRSSANIVDAANNLIGHNGGELGEQMEAIRDWDYPVCIMVDKDSIALCEYIKSFSIGLYSQSAVLARNHWLLEKLSRLLTESGIKHEYIGKKTAMTRSEPFRRFHSFLKLIVNVHDNFSFLLIKDYLGVTEKEYRDIRMLSCVEFRNHFETWKAFTDKEIYTWQKWFKISENTDMMTVIDWMKDIEFDFDTEPIFEFIYGWMQDNYDGTIEGYLSWLATFDVQDEIKEESEGLQLLTVHGAKGLEWPTVIIAGLNEGIFPSKQSISKNELQDETRLMYVAMTRAEDRLFLTSRPIEQDEDGQPNNQVSRFIEWAIG